MSTELIYSNIHILCTEDDAFQRLILIHFLEQCGYQYRVFENGRLARDELLKQEIQFDLVLTDTIMPEMDGFELLSFIKSHDTFNKIPVLMMSADSDYKEEGLKKGALEVFLKPLRLNDIKIYILKFQDGKCNC